MGKHKKATRGEADAQKGTSPTPSSHGGEASVASDTGDAVHNLRDDVASLEEGLSWIGGLSETPFRFLQSR